MPLTTLTISLIVFTVSALVQAAWMIAVGRTLETCGKPGAARVGKRLAVLCLCLLLPIYALAATGNLGTDRGWPSLFNPVEFFLLAALPALVLATASSFGWGSGAWGARDPARIFFWGFLLTAVATVMLWAGMSDMHRGRSGAPADAGFNIVPCALWHLITSSWLMRWAQGLPVGRCLNCDYDLQGLPETAPCPECGTPPPTMPDRPLSPQTTPTPPNPPAPAQAPPSPDSM